jgi:pyridoxal phosphate enzyme (YggS family)
VTAGEISSRLAELRRRIAAAAERAGRGAHEVTLVGVAKRQPASAVCAAVQAGLTHVGESYVQEDLAKRPEVERLLCAAKLAPPSWHFVGRLQRNKARHVAARFDLVETLDRESLGDELDRRAAAAGRRLDVLLQVDVAGEPQKGGAAPEAVPALLERSRAWPALRVVGLMAIPPASQYPEASRASFERLRKLMESLRGAPGADALHALSMGMSADFEVAIEEGATIVRVGTALFGARDGAGKGDA